MAHHEPLKALCPVDWDEVSADPAALLSATFASAQIVVDSIPTPTSQQQALNKSSTIGRARSQTAPAPPDLSKLSLDPSNAEYVSKLRKEWSDLKLTDKNDPTGLNVWKLPGKDGKGAWFARRSVHKDISFDKFRAGLEREFAECLRARKAAGSEIPGAGALRGSISAEKRLERMDVEKEETPLGRAEVYLLSARFGGPTEPRDFVTLFLSSAHDAGTGKCGKGKGKGRSRAPRQFMLVSKPCNHKECPVRTGYTRGQYESVEVIREVPVDPQPLRRTRSSIDLTSPTASKPGPADDFTREAILRAANKVAEERGTKHGRRKKAVSVSFDVTSETGEANGKEEDVSDEEEEDEERPEMMVEWLMVTRSDPGGKVPRFMVERGTPGGITSDARQFLEWLNSKSLEDLQQPEDEAPKEEAEIGEQTENGNGDPVSTRGGELVAERRSEYESEDTVKADAKDHIPGTYPDEGAAAASTAPVPVGFYGMITGALGAAGSVVASRIPAIPSFAGSAQATDSDSDLDDLDHDSATHSIASNDDASSSVHSFLSALEGEHHFQQDRDVKDLSIHSGNSIAPSALSDESRALSTLTTSNPATHDKELKKLQERRRKAQEKIAKMQERIGARAAAAADSNSIAASNGSGSANSRDDKKDKEREREEAVLAKLRAKHEREVARQEEKYQRELKRLEAKRAAEEKRAAERRRKISAREARANVDAQLAAARAERDVAYREIALLKDQVGELQAQNTKLVAMLGKHGLLPGLKEEGWDGVRKTKSVADAKDAEEKSLNGE